MERRRFLRSLSLAALVTPFVVNAKAVEAAPARVTDLAASEQRIAQAFEQLPSHEELHKARVTAVTATTSNGRDFTVRMDRVITKYTDGMAMQVRFPVPNADNPTLDVIGSNGFLGKRPIRDVNGQPLTAGHIDAPRRAELFYVDHEGGYWMVGAMGARSPLPKA